MAKAEPTGCLDSVRCALQTFISDAQFRSFLGPELLSIVHSEASPKRSLPLKIL
jgi:hypothetical protein